MASLEMAEEGGGEKEKSGLVGVEERLTQNQRGGMQCKGLVGKWKKPDLLRTCRRRVTVMSPLALTKKPGGSEKKAPVMGDIRICRKYTGSNLKVIDRRVKLAELILRVVICGLAVLAAVLVGTDTQVKTIFSIQKKAEFTNMKSLVE